MKAKRWLSAFIALLLLFTLCPATAIETSPPTTINLPVTYRDFHGAGWDGTDGYQANPDFGMTSYSSDNGIVFSNLGADLKPVYAGLTDNPTTHGDVYFNMWFNDAYAYNMSMPGTLTFTYDSATGNYTYLNSSFFPLDGQLLGNDGRAHNYHFTMEMHSKFTYKTGQSFSFTGDDDVWVFINNQLVIDLGGAQAQTATVNLDSLGLTAGAVYNLDLFFAERHTTESTFKATTDIVLEQRDTYRICGFKYNDTTNEPIKGWPIYLEYYKNNAWVSFKSTLTNADGMYIFYDLPAGNYRAKEYAQDPWAQVFPGGDGMHYVTLPEEPMIFGIERSATRPIMQIDPSDGSYTKIFDTDINGYNMNGPNGLAYDFGNSVFYYVTYPYSSELGAADLYRYTAGDTSAQKIYDLDQQIACADFYGGSYYYIAGGPPASNESTDDLYEVTFNADGNVMGVNSYPDISGGLYEWTFSGDIAISQGGLIYGVGLDRASGRYQFFSVKRDGSDFRMIDANIGMPLQLAFGSNGVLYGSNLSDNSFYTINLANGDTVKTAVSLTAAAFNDMASGVLYYNFRNTKTTSICGYKFEAGTTNGIAGVSINLFMRDAAGALPATPTASTVTDANGKYCFTGLAAGDYRVTETIADTSHWKQVSPSPGYHDISLPGGASDCGAACGDANFYNFENERLYEIIGTKYNDAKKPLSGFTIILEKQTGTDTWDEITRVVTGLNGEYRFTGLEAGIYRVSEEQKYGWTQLLPTGDGMHIVILPAGTSNRENPEAPVYDFVNRRCYKDETAWAEGNLENRDYTSSNNWGWSNMLESEGTFDYPLYAGAGQNDISKGTLAGYVHVVYMDGKVTVNYEPFDGIEVLETHLWIGDQPLPYTERKNIVYTSAPGQMKIPVGVPFDVSKYTENGQNVYVAAHAVVRIPCGSEQ